MTRGRGKHFWWGASAVMGVLIVLVGWFVGIGPQLAAATTARRRRGLRLQNQALRSSVKKLERRQPGPLRESLQAAVASLPFDSDLPAFTRQITVQAVQDNVVLDSIVIGSPAAVTGDVADPSATPAELLAIPITLSSTGRGADQRAFLRTVQVQGPRRALVSATQLSPAAEGESVVGKSTMTTTLTIFAAPLTSAAETQLQELLRGASVS